MIAAQHNLAAFTATCSSMSVFAVRQTEDSLQIGCFCSRSTGIARKLEGSRIAFPAEGIFQTQKQPGCQGDWPVGRGGGEPFEAI